jgi:hypothetical protein
MYLKGSKEKIKEEIPDYCFMKVREQVRNFRRLTKLNPHLSAAKIMQRI